MNFIKKIISNINKFYLFLFKVRYVHFFLTGVSGVMLNLFFSWIFVEFVFLENTYLVLDYIVKNTTLGIIIGQSVNLIYNFTLHTKVTFKTKKNHKRRFSFFITYSIFMTYIIITPLALFLRDLLTLIFNSIFFLNFLAEYSYLISSAIVILTFSVLNFILFKKILFKEK